MISRPFGHTGLFVSALGFGLGALGDDRVSDARADALLARALEHGITFFDAARSYGHAEARLGRFLSAHPGLREKVVVSTKGGYGAHGAADWTAEAITLGIDQALERLQCSHIDIFHFHSCPLETLRRDDLLEALMRARDAGKLRVCAYSGEGDALAWAARSDVFASLQCSVNLFDQRALEGPVALGKPVLAKRALGNAPWRFSEQPRGRYCETYWLRMRAMALDPFPLAWDQLALRFAAFAPGVSSALVGTASLEHLDACVRYVDQGPLDGATVARVRSAFAAADQGWAGQV